MARVWGGLLGLTAAGLAVAICGALAAYVLGRCARGGCGR